MNFECIEVVCHFVFAGDLGYLWEMVEFDLALFGLYLSNSKGCVSPEDVVKLIGHLQIHFGCYFFEDGIVASCISYFLLVRLMTGWLLLMEMSIRCCDLLRGVYIIISTL